MGLVLATPASAALVYQRPDPNTARRDIVAAHNDGSDARLIAHGYGPYVSPNAQRVAYFEWTGKASNLYVVGLRGRHRKLVAKRVGGPGEGFAWSPDSREIFVAASTATGGYLVDLATGVSRHVRVDGYVYFPSFAPDGDHFAFEESYGDFPPAVRVVDSESLRKRTIADATSPVWGRPGLTYTYSAFRPLEEPSGSRIVLSRREGQEKTLIDSPNAYLYPVAWSADGETLLYGRSTEGGVRARLLDLPRHTVRRFPGELSNLYGISRDGRRILAQRNGDEVVSVHPDGSLRVLANHAEHASWTK